MFNYGEEVDSDSDNIIDYDNDSQAPLVKKTCQNIIEQGLDQIKKIRVRNQHFTSPLIKIFLTAYKFNTVSELTLINVQITEFDIKCITSAEVRYFTQSS